jgi:tetratricopeptide (TPR) repeat protein
MQALATDGPTLLRRLLLALATTLIVARPIVLGEDAGLSANFADPWGMVLTLLWLLAAAGWAAWRFWLRPASQGSGVRGQGSEKTTASQGSGVRGQGSEKTTASDSALTPDPCPLTPGHWYGGLVQTALLVTVALVFVSAERAAAYKFPARLIAWEWFGLFVSFLVVQQLAVSPREQHGLFTVVLAGAVSLSAQGIYQEIVEMPQNRRLAEDSEALRANWAEEKPGQAVNEVELEQLRRRLRENNIFGPYAHPNSYAGFLVLWLPGLVGVAAASRRTPAPAWQKVLAMGCALLALSALWLTHSRGALLGLAAAGAGIGLFGSWRLLGKHAIAALIAVVVLIGLVYGAWRSGLLTTGMGKSGNVVAQRLEYWQTTWQMIRERPWLGVGPGNFGENYPRLMPANAEEKIKDPHNFVLEMWATCGVFAMLALLAALAAFFYQVMHESRRAGGVSPLSRGMTPPVQGADDLRSPEEPVRWEFYLGGMFGLLLGFVLRVNTATQSSILAETYSAAVRSVVWFAAFALLERLIWTDRGRALALTTGIAALLLNLCVSGGIGFPSVAGPLWVAVALALNAAALRPVPWLSRAGAAMILPLPIFIGLFIGYGIYILYPVLSSDELVREAVQAVAYFQSERKKPASEQSGGVRDRPDEFIKLGVIDRLNQAAQLTPGDARIYVQLAWWSNVFWELSRQKSRQELPLAERALRYGITATQLDPHGSAGYWVQYQIRLVYAKITEDLAAALRKAHGDPLAINEREQTAREQYEYAAKTLEKYLPNDPHDAELHFALWHAWSKAGDKEKARAHAVKALKINTLVTMPVRKLTLSQITQLDDWLESDSKANSKH